MNKEDEINELKLRTRDLENKIDTQAAQLLATSKALKDLADMLHVFIENYRGPRKLDIN